MNIFKHIFHFYGLINDLVYKYQYMLRFKIYMHGRLGIGDHAGKTFTYLPAVNLIIFCEWQVFICTIQHGTDILN